MNEMPMPSDDDEPPPQDGDGDQEAVHPIEPVVAAVFALSLGGIGDVEEDGGMVWPIPGWRKPECSGSG